MVTHDCQLRVCIVGAGTRFMSGISVYTYRLANALARSHRVSEILLRQLVPTRLYPGREHVGARLSRFHYDPQVPVFDGVDWYWLPSMFQALVFLVRQRPQVIVFQWWTGTVLHSYLGLALVGRLLGARVVIEFHEVLDPGEARLWFAQTYVRLLAPVLIALSRGFTVHSVHDRALLERRYHLGGRPVAVFPHGPYDHYRSEKAQVVYRAAPPECCNLLFFGVIRPYKGLEDLVAAFEAIPPEEIERYWLTVVGETWEGWALPTDLIARSRYRARISLINRYVPDQEVGAYFAGADVLVLPYHRASASGPLHIGMSYGLPIVVTRIAALLEVVATYDGALVVPPRNPVALRAALAQAAALRGKRFADPHSWDYTAASYDALFSALLGERPGAA